MSRLRILGVGVLILAVGVGVVGCSKDKKEPESSDRGEITFGDAPTGSTSLGLCYAYDIKQMKTLIGGKQYFKRAAPAAIGAKGDKVTGEACAWDRKDPNGDALSLRIEVRDFAKDSKALDTQFAALRNATVGAKDALGIGDSAFSSESKETSLLQVRSGSYLLTLSSRAAGKLQPVKLDTLKLLGTSGLDQLP